jgi:hypothetical protein
MLMRFAERYRALHGVSSHRMDAISWETDSTVN